MPPRHATQTSRVHLDFNQPLGDVPPPRPQKITPPGRYGAGGGMEPATRRYDVGSPNNPPQQAESNQFSQTHKPILSDVPTGLNSSSNSTDTRSQEPLIFQFPTPYKTPRWLQVLN